MQRSASYHEFNTPFQGPVADIARPAGGMGVEDEAYEFFLRVALLMEPATMPIKFLGRVNPDPQTVRVPLFRIWRRRESQAAICHISEVYYKENEFAEGSDVVLS
jgi:hypothetical protein